MRLVDQTLCTGCGACEKACPKGAIRFREDEEGFPAPVIDNAICIECGLCSTVCPAIHVLETRPVLSAYAAQAKDRELLMESTSGALFPVLAREIFRRQGVVFGCVWDAEYNAVFTRAESEEQIGPMKGVTAEFPAPFNKPFYIIFNVAVGGDWPGDPAEDTPFDERAQMRVDWVRVYQRDE